MKMATMVNVPAIGPVKRTYLYVAGAVVVVIVGSAYYMRSRRSSSGVVVDPATGSTGSGGYVNPAPNGPPSGVEVEVPEIIDTNAEWGTAAVARLVEAGWEPMFAAVAIGKYLAGIALTNAEADAVRAAWGMLGKPPVNAPNIVLITTGPAPGSGNPNPPPPPPPPKPAPPRRYVVVQRYTASNPPWQSTLSGIASHTGRSVGQLASWNGISNPNVIHPGQKIYVDPPGTYNGTKKIG